MRKINNLYFDLRKKIIIQDFCYDLNSKQQEAVLNTEGSMLIFAGAGSGKTTVLVKKIFNILNFGKISDNEIYENNISEEKIKLIKQYFFDKVLSLKNQVYELLKIDVPLQDQILVITFTNKAADELKNRLNSLNTSSIWIHTFHAACLRILKKYFYKINNNTNFTIYGDNEKSKVISEILKLNNVQNLDTKLISKKISKAKDNLITPNNYLEHYGFSETNETIAKIYFEYELYLKKMNALDFDNIILYAIDLLKNNLELKLYFQNKFKYIFIDEYQDTNYAQYKFINYIVNPEKNNICVVGDDDQSIYKFRGANIKNILNFENKYKNSKIIRLEQNYRSTKTILEAANNIIKKNTIRKSKILWTDNELGNVITIYSANDQYDEANYIANDIKEKKINLNECAILYRNHNLSINIEMSLKKKSIPYKIIKGISFFQRTEIIDLMSYLYAINNIDDFLRVKRIINKPARTISLATIKILEKIFNDNNINFLFFLKNINNYKEYFNQRVINAIINFYKLIEDFQYISESNNLIEILDTILIKTSYIEKVCKNDETSIKHIDDFKIFLKEYISNSENKKLKDFLQEIALITDVNNDNINSKLTLMTVHAAKGLEFKYIYICGFEDGIFPSLKSSFSLEEEEEERRLCYVAMTRAKKELTITWSKKRILHGKCHYNKPSKFIIDIPCSLINNNSIINPFSTKIKYFFNNEIINSNNNNLKLNINEKIIHKTFGNGVVINMINIKNDFLIIIKFEKHGIKKLMLNYASKYINKC